MAKFIIEGGHPIEGEVTASGNKNEALPAVAACILTDETIVLKKVPQIRDVLTMCQILRELGAEAEWKGEDELHLCAKNIKSYEPNGKLCEEVRASILLVGPLLARFGKIKISPPGGDVIGARRIDTHFEGVEALGGKLYFGPPIVGHIEKIQPTEVFLDEPSVTATENLILLCVISEGVSTLYNAACEPHVVGLCNLLNKMGAKIRGIGSNCLEITGVAKLSGCQHEIGPDFMEVGSFLCLGAITSGELTIKNTSHQDLRFILKTLSRLGINPEISETSLKIKGGNELVMKTDISGRVGSIYSCPWPSFPTDLMSVAMVAATQATGNMIFHEKMYESRMFFTDKLLAMGANIVLCDPHRVVINGPTRLRASRMSSPDVRAGMALLMAALAAKGTSEIDNIYQIERGYYQIEKKLQALGAKIVKKEN